jgi:hypothetical protein
MSKAETYRTPSGRCIALVVRRDFDDFASWPPTFATERERQWLADHYSVASPDLERSSKAHLTANELPLQLTILDRPSGSLVKPHYHTNDRAPDSDTRHQVMVCIAGSARIGLFSRQGEIVGDVVLSAGDLALLYEGHSIETLEDGTRLLEVKQGPLPNDPLEDNVALVVGNPRYDKAEVDR